VTPGAAGPQRGGGVHQGGERALVAVLLGMPEQADQEAAPGGGLDRLDGAVLGPGDRLQAGPDRGDALVVVRGDLGDRAEDRAGPAGGVEPDLVVAVAARFGLVPVVADQLGQVLV
jgi:hypothetical protein